MAERSLAWSEIKARGWTDGAIKRFLGEPDELRPNPHCRSGPRMRLFAEERVERAEQGQEYQEWQARTSARRQAASERGKANAERHRQELLQELQAWEPNVRRMDREQLERCAIEHWNRLRRKRCEQLGDVYWGPVALNEDTLHRICVNYLRHQQTSYDAALDALWGAIGRLDAESVVRERIFSAIADTYPWLADECARQLKARELAYERERWIATWEKTMDSWRHDAAQAQ